MLTAAVCLLIGILTVCQSLPTKPTFPVILIPGDGGSQLEAKLAKPQVVHYFCSNQTDDYYPIWLNLELLTPYVLDCTVDNLRLVYDPSTQRTGNSPGVDMRIVKFGHTDGVEFLDESQISVSSYYAPLAAELTKLGYKNGVNMMGAPYDFRKAPNELKMFYANLTRLFEESYARNGKPALAVCHSLGNMVFTYFLSTKSQAWKDKFVHGFVALSAPFGGAAKLWRLYASGDTLGEYFVNALSIRNMQRSFPSSAFLMPYAAPYLWNEDDIIISTPKKNYTVMMIDELAQDIGYKPLADLRRLTKDLVKLDKMHPGVPVYCVHGWNVSTPEHFTYTGSMFPDTQPYVKLGQGDGTVNAISLQACEVWNTTEHKFDHKYIDQGEHLAILRMPAMINYVLNILGYPDQEMDESSWFRR